MWLFFAFRRKTPEPQEGHRQQPVDDGMYSLLNIKKKNLNFLFKENHIKANDDEGELGSAGHYTRRLESEFVSHVLSLFLKPSADISHVCMPGHALR